MSQRIANCPNCGAQIQFRWSSAVQTVCEYCRSILVRRDVDLEKVGEVADLPPDASPIQIGTEGVWRDKRFTVVGRILYEYEQGAWNEWHIVFQDNSSGWLSDAQAEYAVSFLVAAPSPLPATVSLRQTFEWKDAEYEVTSITRARYRGVEGELPFEYWDKRETMFADLRSRDARFGTIDYSESPPLLFLGEASEFDSLQLKNLREFAPARAGKTAGLNCPNCGGALAIRASEHTLNVVCPQCLSILNAKDPNFQILQRFKARERIQPLLPLGSRGKLRGDEFEVIGFQVRTIVIDGIPYSWHEYLLFHRLKGFRYLTDYNGHWNYVKTVQALPRLISGPRPSVSFLGERYSHFQTAEASTTFVLGEFPWQVRVGETVRVMDFIHPPRILSSETTGQETTWSLGEYIPGAHVWESFKLQGSPPPAVGIFANQPRPSFGVAGMWTACFALWLALFAMALAFSATSSGRVVFRERYALSPAAFVTNTFELGGHTGTVEIAVRADRDVEAFFNFALINAATSQAYDFGRELTNGRDAAVVPHVPPGQYYLRIEPEMETNVSGVSYELTIRRDVPVAGFFWIAALLVVIPPAIQSIRMGSFETKRWQESDYASSSS